MAEAIKISENSYTIENAMDAAIDDVEHRCVLDEKDLWAEIDAI